MSKPTAKPPWAFLLRGGDFAKCACMRFVRGVRLHAMKLVRKGDRPLLCEAPGAKRGQTPFVRSTLRAVPAKGVCPLFAPFGPFRQKGSVPFSHRLLETGCRPIDTGSVEVGLFVGVAC